MDEGKYTMQMGEKNEMVTVGVVVGEGEKK